MKHVKTLNKKLSLRGKRIEFLSNLENAELFIYPLKISIKTFNNVFPFYRSVTENLGVYIFQIAF